MTDAGPCACGRFKSYPKDIPPLADGTWHLEPGTVDVCEVEALRCKLDEAYRLAGTVESILTRRDFWDHAGTLPGEYDNMVDALEAWKRTIG